MVLGNSGIHYDALKLEQDPTGRFQPAEISANVLPTIFYKSKDGKLTEVIETDLRLSEPLTRGRVTLVLGKQQLTAPLMSDRAFGEQRLDFDVREFAVATTASLKVECNGHSRNFPQKLIPGKKWNVFVVPHEHLDVGYSDYQGKVAEVQSRAIDEAMAIARREPDFRFSIDGFWSAEEFLSNRSEQDRQEFLQLV